MKKYALIIISLLLLSSCVFFMVPRDTKDDFIRCYSIKNSNTKLDNKLKIRGIYLPDTSISFKNVTLDQIGALSPNFIFYSNGFCTENPPHVWFVDVNNEDVPSSYFNHGSIWGLYSIDGDTIKAQYIRRPGAMECAARERWFLIINSNTIKQIYLSYYEPVNSKEVLESLKSGKTPNVQIFNFQPLDSLPNPKKSWIIKKKWFWCNKSEYKRWKKESR